MTRIDYIARQYELRLAAARVLAKKVTPMKVVRKPLERESTRVSQRGAER